MAAMHHEEISPAVKLEATLGGGGGQPMHWLDLGKEDCSRNQGSWKLRGLVWVGRVHVQSVGIWRLISTLLREKGFLGKRVGKP